MPARPILIVLILLTGCTPPFEAREPGLMGYIQILETARDARHACAGLGRNCGPPSMESSIVMASQSVPSDLFLPRDQVDAERALAEEAFQAAHVDCRGRGINPGSPRWEHCRVERSIARLAEIGNLR
ncbi:hypothetical protein [Roseomonas xinghualingensis]|uniref:hypothetical protein n=1 Tax=Roseomonas xinghualingensis TaxID=2986475 RepID=UPI0021F16705|nr:hypothetical protein [Roseomonas sp. SXEYE001]MCV4207305.1 hypothetical protein [Roseomonas sp. SXEYE001]